MKPHIGVVAFYYPPSRASGVYRLLAMTNHLVEQGFDVTVFTVTRDFYEQANQSWDDTLVAKINPAIRIERVPAPKQHLVSDIREYGWFRGNYPELFSKVMKFGSNRLWLDQQGLWLPGLIRRMVEVHKERPFDLTLTTGNPYSAYIASWAMKKRFKVPYVLDSRDSWTLNLFTDEPLYPKGHPAWGWEKRTFAGAELIYFVNEPLRRWHQRKYPRDAHKMRILANGFDADLLGTVDEHAAPLSGGLRFGYIGTLTAAQPQEEVWGGWRRAWDPEAYLMDHAGEDDETPLPEPTGQNYLHPDTSMHLYGHLGFFAVSSALANRIPLRSDRTVTFHGPVGKAEIASAYDNLDVLVLIIADSPYVTSGKVFEYMATGKPIVGLYTQSSAARDVLKDYPLVVQANELTVDGVRQAFLAAEQMAREATPEDRRRAIAYAEQFERQRQLEPFGQQLSELTARSRRS